MGGYWRATMCSVLVIAMVALGMVSGERVADGAPRSTAAAFEAGTVCLPGLTPSDLNGLFDAEPGGVIGADYQRAFAMPDGRVLWTFQDAAVRLGSDSITIVHNIAMLQDGNCFTVLYTGSRSAPQPMFFADRTVQFHRWYWPLGAATGDDGRVYVYAAEMEELGDSYLKETVPVGTWVAIFDPLTDTVVSEERPPNSSAGLYGWSATSDDQWTYLYAQCYRQFGFDEYALVLAFDRSCSTKVTVARVPKGKLFDLYQYWDGSTWQANPARAAPIIDTQGRRINADQIEWTGSSFVSVNKEGDWWGDTIYLSHALAATGPFAVYNTMAAPLKCPAAECNSFFATWMPAAAVDRSPKRFVVALSHNRWDGIVTSLYRPTFHDVVAPTFLRAGRSVAYDVGAGAEAVVLNVAVVDPHALGFLTVYPCDTGIPLTSNVNHVHEPVVSNLVIARPDGDGRFCVYSRSTTEVVVDLAGSFSASSSFESVERPLRLVDTRDGTGAERARIPAGGLLRVAVPNAAASTAVALNVVAIEPSAPGFLTVYPCDRDRPGTSNVNYVGEPVVANLTIVRSDPDGAVCIYSLSETDVVVDLSGSFAADGYEPLDDALRLADTRESAPIERLGRGDVLTVEVPTDESTAAVALNVVAVDPAAPGFLTVYPCDIPRPGTSNVNYVNSPVIANLVVARPAADGTVCVYSSAATDVVVDMAGTLPIDSGYVPLDVPERLVDSRDGTGIPGQLGVR